MIFFKHYWIVLDIPRVEAATIAYESFRYLHSLLKVQPSFGKFIDSNIVSLYFEFLLLITRQYFSFAGVGCWWKIIIKWDSV